MELDDKITILQADNMKDMYDGYQLQIDGYNSVNYFLGGNIEAICLHSRSIGGGHCIGLEYSSDEDRINEGDLWGIWFTSDQFDEARDDEKELKGVNISDQLENVIETEPLDASLGGQWRISKWLPKQAEVYDNDYRWSPADTPLKTSLAATARRESAVQCNSDIQGFYYEWNGSTYRIVIDDNYVCLGQATMFGSLAALVGAAAALLVSF